MSERCVVGVDIGGTKTAAALVDHDGTILARAQAPSRATDGPVAVVETVGALVAAVAEGAHPAALGVGSAGILDPETGAVVSATDVFPGWAGTPLRHAVGEEVARRRQEIATVVVTNDVNAHALGEAWLGAAHGARDVLHVAVGTGVGGALILGGRIVTGRHGAAGEIAHLPVPGAEGARCPCGVTGHLEAIAAGPAILATYAERTGDRLDIPALAERCRTETEAAAVVRDAAGVLGVALGGLVNVLDPEVVVVTGGVTRLGAPWWEALRAACIGHLVPAVRGIAVVEGHLGHNSGVLGAARLALGAADRPGGHAAPVGSVVGPAGR